MKKLLFGTFVSLILVSCSKSDDPTPQPVADKYMSTANGNSWNYAYVDNMDASNNDAYTVTSTDRDSTAAGKSYHVYTNTGGGNDYYNITGNDYYALQVFSLGGADTTLENLYLKDNAAIGTSWAQNYNIDAMGVPVQVTITNKIQETGLSRTLGSVAYSNVIHVITTISAPAITTLPGSSLTTDIHYYYAPKYGMIENDAKIDLVAPLLSLDQHIDTKTTLTSANF